MSGETQPIGAGVAETVDRDGAFPRLDEDQRARLRELGRVRTVERGEVLFAAGDESSDFFVIESGAVAIVQGLGEENRVIAIQGAPPFPGGAQSHLRSTALSLGGRPGSGGGDSDPLGQAPRDRG